MRRDSPELEALKRTLGRRLAARREAAQIGQQYLGRKTGYSRSSVAHAEAGRQLLTREFWRTADELLKADGALLADYEQVCAAKQEHEQRSREAELAQAYARALALRPSVGSSADTSAASRSHRLQATELQPAVWHGAPGREADEHEALELARRVTATDVSDETLSRLEDMVNQLAIKYPVTPPQELLEPVRRHVSYVMRLLDARKTLDQHRRLLVVGGWLSLLAATLYIDLERHDVAVGWLATATSLARQTGHAEIHAWRYETQAWQVLTNGDYRRAAELSRAAQQLAPRGSSAAIQATAQEGRAWARLGAAKETYDALNRVERLVSLMDKPETPEHHYRYDPDKAEAYVATTLAWLGDVAAEHHARQVVANLTKEVEAGRWARRLASANIDLALALLLTDRMDEACAVTQESMLSGRLVAANHWRALEVVRSVESRGLPEASDLREAYEMMRRG